jgi:cytochrome c-type biogenesis protein CcmH
MVSARKILVAFLATILALAQPGAAFAVEPDEVLSDPNLEARARALSAELRCLVCQNQSIDDSNAPLARDLRILVRERLKAGDSDEQVRDFIVGRYGSFVLLRPPFEAATLLLWLAPLLVLSAAAAALLLKLRARPSQPEPAAAPLTREERKKLDQVLGTSGERKSGSRPPA